MVAMTIFGLAMGITLVAFVAALKRARHSELAIEGATELRRANDVISEAARSAPQPLLIQSGGSEVLVPPKDSGYATVLATTWIDMIHNVKGSKANQRMLHLSNFAVSAVSVNAFAGGARPAGAITASDIGTYFDSALPIIDLNDVFSTGDTVTIPASPYGAQTTGVINNISNNSGNKTLTLDANLGVDVPNGTRIPGTAGRWILFSVQTNGELRFFPDHRDLTRFSVLARDIDPSPLSDPANPASAVTVPFTLTERTLTLNLQKLPRGTTAGRTVQGVNTIVFVRTDPLIQ